MTERRVDLEGVSHLALVPGTTLLHLEETVFAAMLEGWTRQMKSRLFSQGSSIEPGVRLVKRSGEFTNDYPWTWHQEFKPFEYCGPPPERVIQKGGCMCSLVTVTVARVE